MSRWILIVVIAVAAFLVVQLAQREGDAGPEVVAPRSSPEAPALRAEPGGGIELESLTQTDPSAGAGAPPAAAETAAEPGPSGSGDLSPVTGSQPGNREEYFLDKYGHMGVKELEAALAQLEQGVLDQQNVLFEERFERGLYLVHRPGDPALPDWPTGPGGRRPVVESSTLTDPYTGNVEARISHLPFEEYPAFYELLAERDWLKKRAGSSQ